MKRILLSIFARMAGARFAISQPRITRCLLTAAVVYCITFPFQLAAQGVIHTVHIYNFDFSLYPAGEPVAAPTILPGDTVRWVWDQGFHSTTAVLGQLEFWDSAVQSGGTFDRVFAVPGVFNYYSRPFGFDNGDGTASGMSGVITVIPEPGCAALLVGGLLALWLRRKGRGLVVALGTSEFRQPPNDPL